MVLWRISRHRDLSGSGALKASGRWHHAGQPIVYLAVNPAGALLEVCARTSANDVPPEFTLLRIEGPDLEFDVIRLGDLPRDWRTRPGATRDPGMEWLRKKASVLCQVPSAIVPETVNYLFNPMHRDAGRFWITEAYVYPFDLRLKM
jgi:RES domain-containing protein